MLIVRFILLFSLGCIIFGMSDAEALKNPYFSFDVKDENVIAPPPFNVSAFISRAQAQDASGSVSQQTPVNTPSAESLAFIAPLCQIIKAVQGPWGKAVLIVGAVFVGVNVFIGKFSFTMLIGFVAAGALILSPQVLLKVISGGDSPC